MTEETIPRNMGSQGLTDQVADVLDNEDTLGDRVEYTVGLTENVTVGGLSIFGRLCGSVIRGTGLLIREVEDATIDAYKNVARKNT